MPHIHTNPGEHDATVSAYVVRMQDDEPLCLVHMHRKYNILMQPGGHVELSETPWSAIAHELREETGYTLDEVSVLQPSGMRIQLDEKVVTHPMPLLVNTHPIKNRHFHTDQSFAFVARSTPALKPAEGESEDIQWLTITELRKQVDEGRAYNNVFRVYEAIVTYYLEAYDWLPATDFSLDDPAIITNA
jgi:8-oxo-dGTP pyrophosphatase MutT (NUDIX family)